MATCLTLSASKQLHQVVALTCIPPIAKFNIPDSTTLRISIPLNFIINFINDTNSAAEYTVRSVHHYTMDFFGNRNHKARN